MSEEKTELTGSALRIEAEKARNIVEAIAEKMRLRQWACELASKTPHLSLEQLIFITQHYYTFVTTTQEKTDE